MAQKAKEFPVENRIWWSRAEAAGYLGICPATFDTTIRPAIRETFVLGDPRFFKDDIDEFMRRSLVDADSIMTPARRKAA